MVVPDVLAERASTDGGRLFVNADGASRTFAEMHERAERLASGLASLGIAKGDRVASILPNTIDHVDVIFACARLGAIHVPVNVFLKGDFLRYQLDDAGVSLVIADDEGMAAVKGTEYIAISSDELPTGAGAPDVDLTPGDTMAIIYTSGTTGMPKGCMLPYGYHALQDNTLLEYGRGDVLYTALPLFHGWARGMLFAALNHGLEIHLDAEFSATNVLSRVRETQATMLSAVGAMGMAMLAQPERSDDRDNALRVAFMIPFQPDAERAFTERFGARVQSQMYGQTETGAITFTPLRVTGKPGTIGKASPQYAVDLAADGEVIVRPKKPDTMYTGYWGKPDETASAMRGGWHHTGDIARLGDDGNFVFVDRKKDALRRRGENVSSVQLEAAITAHPKITECAVVAVPSELTEDDIKACIVVTELPTPEDLFAFLSEKLPYFVVPRYVEIVDALPKTATMRVQKHLLRDAGVTATTWDFEKLGLQTERARRRS
jgi:crotonobetaine/carnitine-CoA ligase